jgi:hypothetical protein
MKTMKKKITFISLIIILITTTLSNAQPYNTGIGLRLGGSSSGITVKHFTGSSTALEGIVSFWSHSLFITGLYEKHIEFPNAEGLSWFYGGGAHIGFFSDDYHYGYFYYHKHKHGHDYDEIYYIDNPDYDSNLSFGLDFILGLDYKFKNTPIDLSLDVKPFIDIAPGVYGYWDGALTVRFTM